MTGTVEAAIGTRRASELKPSPDNPRGDITDASVSGLAQSIVERGVLQRLLIHEDGTIVAGHRRWRAIQSAIADKLLPKDFPIPVEIRTLTEGDEHDVDSQVDRLIENLQREDLDPIDEAWAYFRLVEFGQKQADLATKIGMSKAHISKRLALLRLAEPVQAKVQSGAVTLEKALALASIKDEEKQVELADQPEHFIARYLEDQKRTAAVEKFAKQLEDLGLDTTVQAPGEHRTMPKAEEGKDWEEVKMVKASEFKGSVPRGSVHAFVSASWDGDPYARFYKAVKVAKTEVDKKPTAAEKRAKKEAEAAAAHKQAVQLAKREALHKAATTFKKADVVDLLVADFRTEAADHLTDDDATEVCRLVGIAVDKDNGDDAHGLLRTRLEDPALKETELFRILAACMALGASLSPYWEDPHTNRILARVGFDADKVDVAPAAEVDA